MNDSLTGLDAFDATVPVSAEVERKTAVALQYERGVDDAPRVIASGHGSIADQILAIAFERGIKVRKDADLVEILAAIDVDTPIPLEAFAAVAEILSYVYAANASLAQRRAAHLHREPG